MASNRTVDPDMTMDKLRQDEYIVFVTDPTAGLVPGAEVPHGRFRDLVFRSKEEVKQDWCKVVDQLQDILSEVRTRSQDFQLEEVAVELAFSAEGQLVFVSKAGIEATVCMTFKRRAESAEAPGEVGKSDP